jgi:ADP-heptose:LPS heptosyltransferase
MQKILIIRLSSLGDIILTTPLIRAVKELYPGSQIDFCTKAVYSEAIRLNRNINSIIEADNDLTYDKLKTLKKRIKPNNYDLIIDAHNKLNTFYLRLFLNGKKLKLKKYTLRKFLLVKLKINLMKNLPPIVNRYINIIRKDSAKHLPEIETDFESSKKISEFLNSLNLLNSKNLVCIAPSSKHYTKTYPPELFAELINQEGNENRIFLLIGKGDDKIIIENIIAQTGSNVYNLCDKFNVAEIAELMKRVSCVITGDTGPMHIAEAAGARIIMLAGSSVREFGFFPQNSNSVVLENKKLTCRPCSHIGRNSCPKGHFLCMREITPDAINDHIS